MRYASALSFVVTSMARDIVVVVIGLWLFHETLSPLSTAGFGIQLCGLGLYFIVRNEFFSETVDSPATVPQEPEREEEVVGGGGGASEVVPLSPPEWEHRWSIPEQSRAGADRGGTEDLENA